MLGHLALHEHGRALRIHTGGQDLGEGRLVLARSTSGSCGTVMACRSTTQ